MISPKYNQAAERLWEKIEAHRGEYDMDCLGSRNFTWDNFCEKNPDAKGLVREVLEELNYNLSESQCSWAVIMACKRLSMEEYNQNHGLSLSPRV